MPCPHNEITIVQRSQRQSAVAAAAYQSGEKLFCEYDQQVKHYPEKRGIVHNEILLPANAPPEYADRNTLWNAAEAVEKQWNSQLARRWVLTIPREIPPGQYAVLVREFCKQQFVSKCQNILMTYTVYHTRNGLVSIMWCLHRSIGEKHFMSRLLCGYCRKKHEKIQDYIQNQLKEGQIAEQLELEIEDPLHCFALSAII